MSILKELLILLFAIFLPLSWLNFELNFLTDNSFIYFVFLFIAAELLFPEIVQLKGQKKQSKLKSLLYYLRLLFLAVAIIFCLQLLKATLIKQTFYLILATFIVRLLIAKALTYRLNYILKIITKFLYLLLLGISSFYVVSTPSFSAILIISLHSSLLLTAFYSSEIVNHQENNWKYRLPGILYFIFLLLSGIMIFLELAGIFLAACFLMIPLITKLANHTAKLPLQKYQRINQLLLFLFLTIMLISNFFNLTQTYG